MIEARNHPGFTRFFGAYLHRLVRHSFQTVWLRRAAAFPSGGFVAAANHTSWWDGFIPFLIQRALVPATPFFILMSDRELRRFPFFRWAGAFSIDTGSVRRARSSIQYAGARARAGGGVWIFPEGVLTPPGAGRPFTSGCLHAARAGGSVIVPVALRFALLSAQRPEVFVDIGQAIDPARKDALVAVHGDVTGMLLRMDRAVVNESVEQEFVPFIRGNPGIDRHMSRFFEPLGRRL